jgi:hypothetical protein
LEFFTWLEATPLAEWVRVSALGYPLVITLHSIGLAVLVGLAWTIDMRILGYFRGIPFSSLRPMFRISWVGFWINAISGGVLFTSQAASNYVHNVPYLTKMFFVVAGTISVAVLQGSVRRLGEQVGADVAIPQSTRVWAVLSIIFWLAAIVTGRLIAYLS